MLEKRSTPRTKCPSCRRIIDLDRRYQRREIITCPHCKRVLEVIRVFPQELAFPLNPSHPHSGRDNHQRG